MAQMTVGLGIFLSSWIVAAIILYALTRDRWNWYRIILTIFVGAMLLGSLAIGIFFLSDRLINILSIQSEYAGLRLHMTMDEVKYVNGVPDAVTEDTVVSEGEMKGFYRVIETTKFEKEQKVEDYHDW